MPCGHWRIGGPREKVLEAVLVSVGVVGLGEIGDKSQIAMVALAVRYAEVPLVVFLGDRIARKASIPLIHAIAAGLFVIPGVLTLMNVGRLL